MIAEMPEPQDQPPPLLLSPPDSETAMKWLAALSVRRIPYAVEYGRSPGQPWQIRIPFEAAEAARQEIAEYQRVNRDWPPLPADEVAVTHSSPNGIAAGVVCLLLALWYLHTGPGQAADFAFTRGLADTTAIVQGQWYRAITAMTLHGDLTHLLANLACLFFFGIAVSRLIGPGLAWFLILTGGMTANLAGAWLAPAPQRALGASTAVFAAVGMLTMFQAYRQFRHWHDLRSFWHRTWVSIMAGIALLALLGTSPGSDISGHLLGFVAGLVLATLALPVLYRHLPALLQYLLYALAMTLPQAAWHFAN